MLAVRLVRLVDDHVEEDAPGVLLVKAGGGEVHVPGHHVAGLDEDLAEDVLGAAPLMGRDQLLVAVHLADRVDQVVEALRAGVGFVAQHQARPLVVGHGGGPGVGEQVDVDVLGFQQEGVVARLPDRLLAFSPSGHPDRLDHLDLVGLGPAPTRHRGSSDLARVPVQSRMRRGQ